MTTTSQADISTNASANVHINAFVGNGGAPGVGGNGANSIVDVNNGCNPALNKNLNIVGSNSSSNNALISNSGMQRAPDINKRKKLKSRSATAPHTCYSKDHLDAWLETCLKDASNTQLSSSSEFLDYNPTANSKSIFSTQPQQQQQQQHTQQMSTQPQQQQQQQQIYQQHQQQQQSPLQQAYPLGSQQPPHFSQQQQQQQQQQQHTAQTQRHILQATNYTGGYNAPFSQGLQRGVPNFLRHSSAYNNRYPLMFPGVGGGGSGGGGSVGGFYQQNDGSQDFASLPPIVNMMGGGSSELENNSTDVLDGSGSNPNMSRGFRFSDPCLLNPSDNDSKISGQNSPDRRNQMPSELENNKFFAALMEQINVLHETNSKICRNLHETKVDIEALKHAPTWGMRHRRDSLSGLSTHSQPMVFGGGFGTHSPAPTYHSGAYTPGMMTDVVREVKEAARVREDALLNRVKAMVEERQWSMNESNLRMMRDIEELKSQIHHMRADRKEANKRLTHLEAENKYMRQMLAAVFSNRLSPPDIIYENETLRPRKTFPHSRRSQSLNLHYGTIHQQPAAAASLMVEERDEPLHIVESTPSNVSTTDVASVNAQRLSSDLRSSCSSSDGGGTAANVGGVTGHSAVLPAPTVLSNGDGDSATQPIRSPPTFALVSSPCEDIKRRKDEKQQPNTTNDKTLEQLRPTTKELQQELIEAVATRKEADQRIIALEKLVRNLQVHTQSADAFRIPVSNGVGLGQGEGQGHGGGCTNNTSSAKTNQSRQKAYDTLNQHSMLSYPADIFNDGSDSSTSATAGSSHKNNKRQQQMQAHSSDVDTSVNLAHSPPKLSATGPITDL